MSIIDPGLDISGNSNNWNATRFETETVGRTYDIMVDSPTNYANDAVDSGGEVRGNYCIFQNKKGSTYYPTISDGNLKCTAENNTQNPAFGTFKVSSGKWYYEVYIDNKYYSPNVGWTEDGNMGTGDDWRSYNNHIVHNSYSGNGIVTVTTSNGSSGTQHSQSSSSDWAFVTGNTVMVALDADAKKIWFGRNGTWYTYGGGVGNPGTGAYPTASYPFNLPLVPVFDGTNVSGNKDTMTYNFGQLPFTYTPPTGFKSLNTKNLNEEYPFINGPDIMWIKNRFNSSPNHSIIDTVRGPQRRISPNSTNTESTGETVFPGFTSNAFLLGTGDTAGNAMGNRYVAWCWNAGSITTTNNDGIITSTVRVSKESGTSIVYYNGIGSDANTGHGLGTIPDFIIWKTLDDGYNWDVYHKDLGYTRTLYFAAAGYRSMLHTPPTSTTIPVKHDYTGGSAAGKKMIAYCWKEVPGFSKFGSYVGNNDLNGPFVYLGFKPRWILIKRWDSGNGEGWLIYDTERKGWNPYVYPLNVQNSAVEDTTAPSTNSNALGDILSNGFKIRSSGGSNNTSGGNYVYAAFADSPFKYANAR